MSRRLRVLALALAAIGLAAGDLPLPEAPVRVLIPDVKAFDAALTGGFRRFASGRPRAADTAVAAWRRTQVGSKLEEQWSKFGEFLPLTWEEIRKLQATSLGLALLEVGHLEAVLVLETPLAALPASFPKGERRSHAGVAYAVVARGTADGSNDPDRRMGLAWARTGPLLLLASSERALKLALDASLAGKVMRPTLTGLVCLELDLDALRKDRYFRREFLFAEGPERGLLKAALRKEGEDFTEVREGLNEPREGVPAFAAGSAAAAGWEPDGTGFFTALRRGLLEPLPMPAERPVPMLRALPGAAQEAPEDRYATDLNRPRVAAGESPWEEGDLAEWKSLLGRVPVATWGYRLDRDGSRRLVFPWPREQDPAFLEACRATLARRGGPVTIATVAEARELRLGGQFPALALRRTGGYLWVAASAKDLQEVQTPTAQAGLVRWARLDLAAARAEAPRWARVEGPPRPEQVRPLSDRILGLLGWMPATTSIAVERRRTASGWAETVRFGSAGK